MPDNVSPEKEYQLVVHFHGSLVDSNYSNSVEVIKNEFENGRWIFDEEVNNSCIFLCPVIPREDEVKLSNGLEVDPQSMFPGCLHNLCKVEYPHLYSPHMVAKEIIAKFLKQFNANYKIKEKALLFGVSAGGSFASRFAFMYPEMVHSFVSFLSPELVIPKYEYKDLDLNFPFGLSVSNDYETVNIHEPDIDKYIKIPKMLVVDTNDENVGKNDHLYWEFDKNFYERFTKIFGKKYHERAYSIFNLLTKEFNDQIELLITSHEGHTIDDKVFDSVVTRFIKRALNG